LRALRSVRNALLDATAREPIAPYDARIAESAAIEAFALSKTYRGDVRAVVGLDLRVERGEFSGFSARTAPA
jgi:hypothetical protein